MGGALRRGKRGKDWACGKKNRIRSEFQAMTRITVTNGLVLEQSFGIM